MRAGAAAAALRNAVSSFWGRMEGLRETELTSRPYNMQPFDAGALWSGKLCLMSLQPTPKCGFLLMTAMRQDTVGGSGVVTVCSPPSPDLSTVS